MNKSTRPERDSKRREPDFARSMNWWGLMMIGLGMAALAFVGLSLAQS